ncbi:MAG: DUF4365 domain-containing protein [Acidobacteriota bacterium]
MHRSALLEELSLAYVHATATAVGASSQRVVPDFHGADVRFTWEDGSDWSPRYLDAQLKATAREPHGDPSGQRRLGYDLEVKDYERLRSEKRAVPLILVVLFAPQDQERWVEHSEEQLVMRRCAYWLDLRGAPATANRSSLRVWLPAAQRFDGAQLRALLRGERPASVVAAAEESS